MVGQCRSRPVGVTCVQLPPVDVAEKGVRPELVTAPVFEAHPIGGLFSKEPLAEQLCVLAECVRILHLPRQHALLHLLAFNLSKRRAYSDVICSSRTNFCWGLFTDLLPSISKRVLSSYELKQCHSQREVVHTHVILLSLQHLWRHVPWVKRRQNLIDQRKSTSSTNKKWTFFYPPGVPA